MLSEKAINEVLEFLGINEREKRRDASKNRGFFEDENVKFFERLFQNRNVTK